MKIRVGDVWFAEFPYEDDPQIIDNRPVIVLDVNDTEFEVLSVKVTKSKPRDYDRFDTPIVQWQKARLHFPSTARVSKTMHLPKSAFIMLIGALDSEDLKIVTAKFMEYINSK